MDKAADPYDLITVLLRLEEIGRDSGRDHPVGEDDAGRAGLFRKMLRSVRPRRFWADGSAPHKSRPPA